MSQEANKLIDDKITYQSKLKISLIVLNLCLSSFYFGYCIVYLGQIEAETLKKIFNIDLSAGTTSGLLNGCIPIGALIGALSSSVLIARFSRRKCLLIMNAFAFTVGALIYIQYFPALVFFRLCQGFCVGFFSAIVPLMIKELSPTEISGTLGSYAQLNICLGVFIGCFFAYILKKITGDTTGQDFWYISFGLTEITIAIQTVILIFVYPYETPKYLLSVGKEEQARRLIEIIYKAEYVDEILEEKKIDLQSTQTRRNVQTVATVLSQQSVLGSSNSTITVVIAIHLAVMQQFSGINAVAVYGGDIAGKAVSGELALLMPSLINLEQVLATFVTSYLLTRFGRRTILLYGALFEGIACGFVMIGFFIKDTSGGQSLILLGLFLFTAVFGLSLGPVVWLYIPEIVQPKIVPYSTASNWISASLVIILFPIATDDLLNGNPGVLFIFFTAWCLGSFVFNNLFVLETKDKTQKAIRQEYANKRLC